MLLAFFLEALIKLYIPSTWITGPFGGSDIGAIGLAALLGMPLYVSNLAPPCRSSAACLHKA
jgi:uncharacterized protein